MSVPRRCISPVRCWQAAPPKRPGVRQPVSEFCISRYHASIAFAGGAIVDGVWGLERRVTGVAGVAIDIN